MRCGVAILMAQLVGVGTARGEARAPVAEAGGIIVVKRAGVTAYEEVAEEFADHCRVRARVLTLDDHNGPLVRAQLRRGDVVVAVGQRALDAVRGAPAHVISALAFAVPRGVIPADEQPPPEAALRALKAAKPAVRRVGVVYGPGTAKLVERVAAQARALDLELVRVHAPDGPGAIRNLRERAAEVDALWLAPDLDVLTPQLFQFALSLEIRRNLPLVAVTRQQVQSGALLAIDADPHAVGRQAADLAYQLLAGTTPASLLDTERPMSVAELTVNRDAARRLGIDEDALARLGARIE
jgi:hypothetical protein